MEKVTVSNIKDYINQIDTSISYFESELSIVENKLLELNYYPKGDADILEQIRRQRYEIIDVMINGMMCLTDADKKKYNAEILINELNQIRTTSADLEKYVEIAMISFTGDGRIRLKKCFERLDYLNNPSKIKLKINDLKKRKEDLNSLLLNLRNDLNSCYKILTDLSVSTVLKDEDSMKKIVDGWIETRKNKVNELSLKLSKDERNIRLIDELTNSQIFFHESCIVDNDSHLLYDSEKRFKDDCKKLIVRLKNEKSLNQFINLSSKYNNQELNELIDRIKNIDINDKETINLIIDTYKDSFKELSIIQDSIIRANETKKISQELMNEFFAETNIDTRSTLFITSSSYRNTKIIKKEDFIVYLKELITENNEKNDDLIKFLEKFDYNDLSNEEFYFIYSYIAEKKLSVPTQNIKLDSKYIHFNSDALSEAKKFAQKRINDNKEFINKIQSEINNLNNNDPKFVIMEMMSDKKYLFSPSSQSHPSAQIAVLRDDILPINYDAKHLLNKINDDSMKYNDLLSQQENLKKQMEDVEKREWFCSVKNIIYDDNGLRINISNHNYDSLQLPYFVREPYDLHFYKKRSTDDKFDTILLSIDENIYNELKSKRDKVKIIEENLGLMKKVNPYEKDEYLKLKKEIDDLENNHDKKKDNILYSLENGVTKDRSALSKFFFRFFRKKQYKKNVQKYENTIKKLYEQSDEVIDEFNQHINALEKSLNEAIRLKEVEENSLGEEMLYNVDLMEKFNSLSEDIRGNIIPNYVQDVCTYNQNIEQIKNIRNNYFNNLKEVLKIKNLPKEIIDQINMILEDNEIVSVQNTINENTEYYATINDRYYDSLDTVLKESLLNGEVDMSMEQDDAVSFIQGRKK